MWDSYSFFFFLKKQTHTQGRGKIIMAFEWSCGMPLSWGYSNVITHNKTYGYVYLFHYKLQHILFLVIKITILVIILI